MPSRRKKNIRCVVHVAHAAELTREWTCSECGEHFISEMARDQHARKKHGRRCNLSRKIGDTSTCPNCRTDFRQRFSLVRHARDKRVKARGCRDFWRAQRDIDSDLADRLWEQDLILLRAARKEGRSHAIACGPARRHDGTAHRQGHEMNSYCVSCPFH